MYVRKYMVHMFGTQTYIYTDYLRSLFAAYK